MTPRSRSEKAWLLAAFNYVQFGLAIVSGVVLIPFILAHVGTEHYGLWLATGELLGYAGLVDLGVVTTLPYIIAQYDGQGDRAAIGRTLVGGCVVGSLAALGFLAVACVLWLVFPSALGITDRQWAILTGPLAIAIIVQAFVYPLAAFSAMLSGTQDVIAYGTIHLTQRVLQIVLVLGLLWSGWGLYALAVGTFAPALLNVVACSLRTLWIAPDLFRDIRWPGWSQIRFLWREGMGAWMASLGWRMTAASTSIVILAVSNPESAVIFACTAKLALVLSPLVWQLSDASLIGLAQLYGEGKLDRAGEVMRIVLRVSLAASGGIAFMLVLFNAPFVAVWVGPDKYATNIVNLLIALGAVALSVNHVLGGVIAAIKYRLTVGMVTLGQGLVYLVTAFALGPMLHLAGIATGTLISALAFSVPVYVWLIPKVMPVTAAQLLREAFLPWIVRFGPLIVVAWVAGQQIEDLPLWAVCTAAPIAAAVYAWLLYPLCAGVPIPARLKLLRDRWFAGVVSA